jgi:hypothetical protein
MRTMSWTVCALAALLTAPALAQQPAPAQEGTPLTIRGTIEKLDGQTMVVKSREGAIVPVIVPATININAPVKKSLTDIKAGDMVGSTSVKKADGKLHSLEIHFLPATAQERQFTYDLAPDSTMTNAKVAVVTGTPDGNILRVNINGQPFEVIIDPTTPIVANVPGDASLLKPGAFVRVQSLKKADGTITATGILAEKDGVKPPN